MAELDLIRIASENVAAYNAEDWERLRAILAPDIIYDEVGSQRRLQGPDNMIAAYQGWKRAAPDGKGEITKALASGNAVTLEVHWTGTHAGPLEAPGGLILATGRSWRVASAQIITFEGEKIKEFRQYFDMRTILEQLEVTPKTADTKADGQT